MRIRDLPWRWVLIFDSEAKSPPVGLIVGLCVGSIAIVCLVLAWYLRRRRQLRQKHRNNARDHQEFVVASRVEAFHYETQSSPPAPSSFYMDSAPTSRKMAMSSWLRNSISSSLPETTSQMELESMATPARGLVSGPSSAHGDDGGPSLQRGQSMTIPPSYPEVLATPPPVPPKL